jgi:diaminohydroxyphosphoribosylaminopyrimidine deaminase/5-amino-6-(5-phosphoribosylamino)uracil reductase
MVLSIPFGATSLHTFTAVSNHEIYMKRCLELAAMGAGNVAPNPMVGCVIVHNAKIIGEGYHEQYGKAHAEVMAIHSVKDKSLLSESTLYVSLEPCAHHGKTPPCSDLIVEHKLKHVVICNRDPFAEVNGKGIARLEAAGITVETGTLEAEGRWLNRRFFTFHEKNARISF